MSQIANAANDDTAGLFRLFGEDEIQAYANGGLTLVRRREVEGYLACNPDLAARVMGALHRRREPQARRRRFGWAALAIAGLAVCGVSAWAGSSFDGDRPPSPGWRQQDGERAPGYVEDAVMSQRASVIRATMRSQVETTTLDTDEISRALNLRLPSLPGDWRLLDVQVFPSDDGPGVSLVAVTPAGVRYTLFAVRADTPVTERPVTATNGRERVVYWERRDVAFVLGGNATAAELLIAAKALARS